MFVSSARGETWRSTEIATREISLLAVFSHMVRCGVITRWANWKSDYLFDLISLCSVM